MMMKKKKMESPTPSPWGQPLTFTEKPPLPDTSSATLRAGTPDPHISSRKWMHHDLHFTEEVEAQRGSVT